MLHLSWVSRYSNTAAVTGAVLILFLGPLGCSSTPEAVFQIPEDPVFHLSSYAFDPSEPLVERVGPIPPFVLEYLEEMDGRSYASYTPTAAEMAMIEEYLSMLPRLQRRVLQERLVGIYFLDPFLGGGFTEYVVDSDGEIHAFMAFNALTLRLDLSDWITYRENTAFGVGDGETIRADCGSQYTGFLHVLLHEATHVVDYVEGITPYLRNSVPSISGGRRNHDAESSFTSGIWKDFAQVEAEHDFELRRKIAYYGLNGGPLLSMREAATAYGQLTSSPFVSLYAGISAVEDLAELVAWYHLSHELGQPHRIICSFPLRPDRVFEFEPRTATEGRRAVLEAFY